MRILNYQLIMVTLLCLGACKPGIEPIDTAALASELLQVDRDFAALSESTDPKQAFAAYLAPNAIMIGLSGEPVEGYEAALAGFGDGTAIDLHWQPQFAEVAKSGDMGWTWGRYQLLVDEQLLHQGKYVNIWIRQADGSWKVRVDMGNKEPE